MDCELGYSLVEMLIVVAIIVTIAAIAIPSYIDAVNAARAVSAMGDIKQMQYEIEFHSADSGDYPISLADLKLGDRVDPWGHPYQYFKISGAEKGKSSAKGGGKGGGGGGGGSSGGARKDKNLHPLNTDFDLYSMGRDGLTQLPLTAKVSKDDVIRANDGGFIGLASNY